MKDGKSREKVTEKKKIQKAQTKGLKLLEKAWDRGGCFWGREKARG